MARDRVAEISEIRSRKGKYGSKYRAEETISSLHRRLSSTEANVEIEYVPIRLVTAIEVFIRECVANLVDFGEPYTTRVKSISKNFKFDFELTKSIVEKRVSFGELISHIIAVNSISDIDALLSDLTNSNLVELLSGVTDRWNVEVLRDPPEPIIDDVDAIKATLQRLFEVRHVLVHELPEQPPCDDVEVRAFVSATSAFTAALREVVDTLIYGRYALTQLEMNEEAKVSAENVDISLASRLQTIDPDGSNNRFQAAQACWMAFRESEATYVSRMDMDRVSRGSIAPLIYWSSWERLTKERIDWLTDHFDDE